MTRLFRGIYCFVLYGAFGIQVFVFFPLKRFSRLPMISNGSLGCGNSRYSTSGLFSRPYSGKNARNVITKSFCTSRGLASGRWEPISRLLHLSFGYFGFLEVQSISRFPMLAGILFALAIIVDLWRLERLSPDY